MKRSEVLAYLGGVIDSDGYLKVTTRGPYGTSKPYYNITVGLQQLWPGPAVHLFARTFEGMIMKPMIWRGHRPMARCEIHERKASAAVRRLLPYLLVKKNQALLLLELRALKLLSQQGLGGCSESMEVIRDTVLSLHDGSGSRGEQVLPVSSALKGYEKLGPLELGWSRCETFAYLAGVMDSDGNLRVEKKVVKGMLGPFYRINIRASQVIPSPAIQLLARTFGGHVTIRGDGRPNHRDLEHWSLHDRSAISAIEALLPYLLVKKQEAYLLMDLRRLKAEGKKGLTEWVHPNRWHRAVKMRKRCYTPEQVAEFESIKGLVEALHSGVSLGTKSSSAIPPKPRELSSPPKMEVD